MTIAPIAPAAEPVVPVQPPPVVERYPYNPESVDLARRLVKATLSEWGLPELADAAVLVVAELVKNALHTGCATTMRVSVHQIGARAVQIAVRDGSRSLPVMIQPGVGDDSTHGLPLVHKITGGRWGASLDPFGKVVYAHIGRTGHLSRPALCTD
ncbi:ATP-binding protein [Kitasatospora sp. NPDC048343]|uniref:ATP-binding protein n=1 Tax=Kitasatospora sp. NPDC048343 TaxID=3154717 RepID=UPI0033C58175